MGAYFICSGLAPLLAIRWYCYFVLEQYTYFLGLFSLSNLQSTILDSHFELNTFG